MSLRLLYEVLSGDYGKMMQAAQNRIARSATGAMKDAGAIIKRDGRAAMAAGGLSTRFQNTFRVEVYPKNGVSLTPAVFAFSKIPWAGVFEDTPSISGKMWVPIEANLPLQPGGKRWTPKDFINLVGPLRGGRHGSKPLLFAQVAVGQAGGVLALPSRAGTKRAIRAREVYNKAKTRWVPVFVLVTTVRDPKLFDITAVVNRVNSEVPELYLKNWNANG
jgi:hypothetical protein